MAKALKNKICPTCHGKAKESGHLCVPADLDSKECDWCGSIIPNARHLCDGKLKDISYICNSCGRTAVKAEFLCKPKKISKKK